MHPVRSNTSFRRRRREGLTLIEVVAGLALMASILVAVLLARSRFERQWTLADRRLQAVRAADALLGQWWQKPADFPRNASGPVPAEPNLRWRTRLIDNRSVRQLSGFDVRLEILDAHAQLNDTRGGALPVVAVDVVVPDRDDFP